MDTLQLFQHYWWLIISLLGALLVFLLFVQGGQRLIYLLGKNDEERNLIINSLGRKWEFTFTTLVTFGGAFFASFPLFYSTSFGGAFYVWMAILLVFVIQAVAYEYRRKPSNVLGQKTFDLFLVINGALAPLLLGMAVSTLFTGAEFTVDRLNLANQGQGGAVVISQWATAWHGLDALANIRNWLLGLTLAELSMILGAQWLMNSVKHEAIFKRSRHLVLCYAVPFVVFFVAWVICLLVSDGMTYNEEGVISVESYKYLHNLIEMPLVAVVFLVGVVLVLWSIWTAFQSKRSAIWWGGIGTVLTVLGLLLTAGWNNTVYYPSLIDMQSSLTIENSSSSLFTLRTMTYVSVLIPFVFGYIWYAWRAISRKPLTEDEMKEGGHQY